MHFKWQPERVHLLTHLRNEGLLSHSCMMSFSKHSDNDVEVQMRRLTTVKKQELKIRSFFDQRQFHSSMPTSFAMSGNVSRTLGCSIQTTTTTTTTTTIKQPPPNNMQQLRTQQFIGSPTRFIHDCIQGHFNNEKWTDSRLLDEETHSTCQNKDYKGIENKSIVQENDPGNLPQLELKHFI